MARQNSEKVPRTMAKKTKVPGKEQYRRKTFMFDQNTERETAIVQRAIRATTASEAVRYSVRKIAELTQHVKAGGKVYVDFKDKGRSALVLDIPAAP